MGFWERLMRGGMGGHGGGHHGGSRSHGHGGHGGGYYPPSPPAHQQGGQAPAQAGVNCGQCNMQNATGAKFCSGCGGQLMAASCQGCGTPLAPGARFCNQCGKPSS